MWNQWHDVREKRKRTQIREELKGGSGDLGSELGRSRWLCQRRQRFWRLLRHRLLLGLLLFLLSLFLLVFAFLLYSVVARLAECYISER